jgi:GAF domain-containing protein
VGGGAQHSCFHPRQPADDPRVEYVPELEEERFQSLLSVPIVSRDGNVIGVINAHTEAPREFTQAEVDFVVTTASLIAGAIENARLSAVVEHRVGGMLGFALELMCVQPRVSAAFVPAGSGHLARST